MATAMILIPDSASATSWPISAAWLKLSLKYGLIGPWTPNWSVAFDRHSLLRGPSTGSPTVADLSVTTLMNSNVVGKDLALASRWLSEPDNHALVEHVRLLLCQCGGLQDAPPTTLAVLDQLFDRLEQLPGIKMAKIAKWFSAWAPSHVPMIDQWVRAALVGKPKGPPWFSWLELLTRYQSILISHFELLQNLGGHLSQTLILSKPIPPVRVLDSLLWFDWYANETYHNDFAQWITTTKSEDGYVLTALGAAYESAADPLLSTRNLIDS